jgi:hypothetical protein
MENQSLLIVLIVATLLSVVACHVIARSRGGNGVYWGIMGFLFGPLAIPFAFLAKPKRPLPEDSTE